MVYLLKMMDQSMAMLNNQIVYVTIWIVVEHMVYRKIAQM